MRTLTAPSCWHSVNSLNFACASCQKWDDGYYSAYRRLAEEDLSFVVHLGDYLRVRHDENGGFRGVPVPEQYRPACTTLERYRLQHGLYNSDPDLQRARISRSPGSSPGMTTRCRTTMPGSLPTAASRTRPSPRAGPRPTRRSGSTSRCVRPMIDANPHIKFFDGDRRGYVRCNVDREAWRTDLRMVTTVSRGDAPVYTFESFVVENGRPGAIQV